MRKIRAIICVCIACGEKYEFTTGSDLRNCPECKRLYEELRNSYQTNRLHRSANHRTRGIHKKSVWMERSQFFS